MKAIILAAGEGKRLQPLTNDKPKCMVDLFGKSLLEYQIDVFRTCNISDISIITGYKNEMIHFPDIQYYNNPNFETTNMVETLFCAENALHGDVIISYGDIIFEKKVLQKLIRSEHDNSVIVDLNWKKYWEERFENPLEDAESLVQDAEGFIHSIGQNVSDYADIQSQYIGLMKFQDNGLRSLKEVYKNAKTNSISGRNILNPNLPFSKSYMTDLLQEMISSGHKIMGIPINGGWLELDSISDYDLYNKKHLDGTLSEFINIEK